MDELDRASECIFCKIAAREIAAEIVHSSDSVVAFRDINPAAPVHLLLIPKRHIESAASIREGDAGVVIEILRTAGHLAKAEGIDRSGWRLVTNVGPEAGQSVHHLHFHLLGGRRLAWPPG